MSSLTLKGKPLDQASLASSSSAPSLAAAASNAPSTGTLDITYKFFLSTMEVIIVEMYNRRYVNINTK